MLIKSKDNIYIPSSEITSEDVFLNRRALLTAVGLGTAVMAFPGLANERQSYVTDFAIQGPA